MQAQSKKNIGRSAAIVGIAVFCSRILGLIREQVFAGLFGAGFAYDSFVVAFRIPNLLRDLFGEGALSAAFVTVFSDYDTTRSREETWQLASNILSFFTVALSTLVLLGIWLAPLIVALLAPDFSEIAGKSELTVLLTRIMLPFLVCISLAAVVMGMLNTKGRFFVPAIASSFFNLGSIVGGTALAYYLPSHGYPAIAGMACGTLIGGLMQLGIQLPSLYKLGFHFRPQLNLADPGLRRVLKLMIPATIGLSATQLNIFINTNFAASCSEGAVSWLNYAFRLVQLPIGIFGVALSIAMLPLLAKQAAQKKTGEMRETIISALSMVFALTLPATFGLAMLAEPIIKMIFEHGAFTSTDTVATAHTLALYAVGLFAYSANKILVPSFYAINKTKYPVIASFIAVVLNIVIISCTLERFGHLAIALSTSCTMIINFIFLFSILSYKIAGLSFSMLIKNLLKITISCGVMIAIIQLAQEMMPQLLSNNSVIQTATVLTVVAGAGGGYLLVLHLLGFEELQQVFSKVGAKFRRKS